MAAGGEPDVVLACCGDVPTLETLAATDLLRQHLPDLAVRVVNVVDLMRLQPESEHPHGLSDADFDALFTTDKPVVFAWHGYPSLIHQLDLPAHQPPQHPCPGLQGGGNDDHALRHGHAQRPRPLPPGDGRDRPGAERSGAAAADVRAEMVARRAEARDHTRAVGDDLPSVRDWSWPY